jgi:hypothetical protein
MTDEQLITEIERQYDSGDLPEDLRPVYAAELTLHYRHARFWNDYFQKRYEKQREEGKNPEPPTMTPVRDFGMTEQEARDILRKKKEEWFPGGRRDSEPTALREGK